jgi:hypothetical protein
MAEIGLPNGVGWADKYDRCRGGLAEKLMAEKCFLRLGASSHFSAINLSALQKEMGLRLRLRR